MKSVRGPTPYLVTTVKEPFCGNDCLWHCSATTQSASTNHFLIGLRCSRLINSLTILSFSLSLSLSLSFSLSLSLCLSLSLLLHCILYIIYNIVYCIYNYKFINITML